MNRTWVLSMGVLAIGLATGAAEAASPAARSPGSDAPAAIVRSGNDDCGLVPDTMANCGARQRIAAAKTPNAPAASGPLALLKSIYAGLDKPREPQPFSKRLAALYDAAGKRSEQLHEPVAGLDFDYAIDGQDHEPGTAATVRYQIVSQSADKASVRVTFRNSTPRELRYDLVLENGRWLIDDVRSVKNQPWVLSRLLQQGARTGR